MKLLLKLSFILFLISGNVFGQKAKKFLFIGSDGTRGEAMKNIPTPNLDILTQRAVYSFDAINKGITISGPGWTNLLTGVSESKHRVVDNSFRDNRLHQHPDILSVTKEHYPESETAAFYTWLPIGDILDQVDLRVAKEYTHNGDHYIHRLATEYLQNGQADATVVYYADVDVAGHTYGFNENIKEYYTEIVQFDRYVGDLIDAINSRENRDEEEWLILLSTDHGGINKSHGGKTLQERNVFVIVAGDQVSKKEIVKNQGDKLAQDGLLEIEDLKKYGYHDVPTQLDIAVTIYDYLGIDGRDYGLEGRSLLK